MAHKSLLDGTGHEITGGKAMIGGTAYAVSKGRAMQDGTVYEVLFNTVYLEPRTYDSGKNATTNKYEITSSAINLTTRGGSGTGYAGAELLICKNGKPYLMPKGTVLTYSYTGTRYNHASCAYGLRVFTDTDDSYASKVYDDFNVNRTNRTYTLTKPCYAVFLTTMGGVSTTALYATLKMTKLLVDGEAVWAK